MSVLKMALTTASACGGSRSLEQRVREYFFSPSFREGMPLYSGIIPMCKGHF